jgi:hypothetical protein
MAQKKGGSVLDRISEKAAEDPRGRLELAKFLTQHHDEFEARLARGPVNWQVLPPFKAARVRFWNKAMVETFDRVRSWIPT